MLILFVLSLILGTLADEQQSFPVILTSNFWTGSYEPIYQCANFTYQMDQIGFFTFDQQTIGVRVGTANGQDVILPPRNCSLDLVSQQLNCRAYLRVSLVNNCGLYITFSVSGLTQDMNGWKAETSTDFSFLNCPRCSSQQFSVTIVSRPPSTTQGYYSTSSTGSYYNPPPSYYSTTGSYYNPPPSYYSTTGSYYNPPPSYYSTTGSYYNPPSPPPSGYYNPPNYYSTTGSYYPSPPSNYYTTSGSYYNPPQPSPSGYYNPPQPSPSGYYNPPQPSPSGYYNPPQPSPSGYYNPPQPPSGYYNPPSSYYSTTGSYYNRGTQEPKKHLKKGKN